MIGDGTRGRSSAEHGLAFLTLLSFVTTFLAARTFTMLAPGTVIVAGGVHFHHFWYGLAMVVGAGWLAIASTHPEFDRVYAIVFGLGSGLIGDEVGLLLTLGDYQSELTYVFFVGVLAFAGIGLLLVRYRAQLERDVLSLGAGERMTHLGIFIACLSAVAWAFGFLATGLAVTSLGGALALSGVVLHRRKAR